MIYDINKTNSADPHNCEDEVSIENGWMEKAAAQPNSIH